MAVSNALATAMLGGLPGTLYVQLHSGDPGANGTSNVVIGPARGSVALSGASGGQRTAAGIVDVPSIPAGATVTHVSYWDAPTAGTFHFPEPLGSSVSFIYAGTLRFASQVFTVQTGAQTGGSQTATSVNSDVALGSETNLTRMFVRVTDSSSTAESIGTNLGILSAANDAVTAAEVVGVGFRFVVADTATGTDASAATAIFRSATGDTSAGTESVGATVGTFASASDATSSADSNATRLAVVVADSATAAESNTAASVAASDTTAPVVGTLTVTPGTGTACTLSATITDAVGVAKWLLAEGASDPGAADPGQTGATTVSGTTVTLTNVAFTSTAPSTMLRYFRLHAWDAEGNHGVSAVANATVTIAAGTPESFVMEATSGRSAFEKTAAAYNGTNGTVTLNAASFGSDTGKSAGYLHTGLAWVGATPATALSSLKLKVKVNTIGGTATKPPMPLRIRAALAGGFSATAPKITGIAWSATQVEWTIPSAPAAGDWLTSPELISLATAAGWTPGAGTYIGFCVDLSDAAGAGAGTPLATFIATQWGINLYSGNDATAGNRPVLLVNGAT